jgi:hypothetical protein
MKPCRTIWLKLLSLGQRRVVKREIDEYLRFHLEKRTAQNIASAMPAGDAAREAGKPVEKETQEWERMTEIVARFLSPKEGLA